VKCLACTQAHQINPKTGKVLGSDDSEMREVLLVHDCSRMIRGSPPPMRRRTAEAVVDRGVSQ
jgi:hypothetical protein